MSISKKRRLPPSLWAKHRQEITHSYRKQSTPLAKIAAVLGERHGFEPTEIALKQKLSRWKVKRAALASLQKVRQSEPHPDEHDSPHQHENEIMSSESFVEAERFCPVESRSLNDSLSAFLNGDDSYEWSDAAREDLEAEREGQNPARPGVLQPDAHSAATDNRTGGAGTGRHSPLQLATPSETQSTARLEHTKPWTR